jgi:hypothetical protein
MLDLREFFFYRIVDLLGNGMRLPQRLTAVGGDFDVNIYFVSEFPGSKFVDSEDAFFR